MYSKIKGFSYMHMGVFRFPRERAAHVAVSEIKKFSGLDAIYFVCFKQKDYEIYKQILNDWKICLS